MIDSIFYSIFIQCMPTDKEKLARAYWKNNLKILGTLLVIWFTVSIGCGILFVDQLNNIQIGGFELGFWFAQQGSIYCFVILIFVYSFLMNRLDKKYGYEDNGNDEGDL